MRFWFLDFEGALSLPVTSQTGVVFNPSCAVMLTDLSKSNSDLVAIISSAPLTDIRAKIPVDGIIIGGSNGLEWSLPDGRHLLYDSCLEEQLQLRRKVVMPWLEVLGRKPGIEVEDRKWSVIIHRHKSGRAVSDKVVTDIVSWATHEKLFIRRNGDSLEVHLIQEFNKSRGAAFLAGTLNMSPEEDTILYVGDTKTDAVAMWWAIMTGGTAIMVGSHPEIPGAICVQDQQELMETVQRFQNSGNTALTTKRSRKKLAHGPTAPKSGTFVVVMARFTGYSLPTGTHYRLYMMLQTTIPIHCSSNSPRFEAGNSCLRGHFINRDLSRLLVLILLILTPLTYSNDSIPNFQPDGVSSFSLKTKTGTTVAVTRPDLPITVTVTAVTVVSLHSTHSNPHISPVRSSQPSRAPPA